MSTSTTGADLGFQVRGGAHLKNCAEQKEARKLWGYFVCKNKILRPKKSYFFQLRREARNFLGYFVWKITILRQKIIFFPPPPGSAPVPRHKLCYILSKQPVPGDFDRQIRVFPTKECISWYLLWICRSEPCLQHFKIYFARVFREICY